MAIYVTSDLHLLHDKEFIYKPRGFTNTKDMSEVIIDNLRKTIKYDDDLYILGDIVMGGADNLEKGLALLDKIPGRVHIVKGNHDSDKKWWGYTSHCNWNLVEAENAIYLKYNKYHFYLSHFPTITSNHDDNKSLKQRLLCLCGHSHTPDKWADFDKGPIYHVEVDAHDCKPILLDSIIQDFKDLYEDRQIVIPEQDVILQRQEFIVRRCDKCVWQYNSCSGPLKNTYPVQCPPGITYKRDPPDGGYYG